METGWGIFNRNSEEFSAGIDTAHGVEASKPEKAIAGALIEPVLSRADSDGLPCYLETFDERDLPFYEERCFRIAGAGRIPGGGPNFWALMKRPRGFHLNSLRNNSACTA
jgi:hypothetical protein